MRIRIALGSYAAAAALAAPSLGQAAPAPMPMPMPSGAMSMSHQSMMMTMMAHMSKISVQASADVEYTPDIAHVTLGVNGEAASASAAASDIAARATSVIAALKGLSIATGSIQTSGYNLYYRERTETVKGAFVASESIRVKAPVDKAGAVIDAAINAGANSSYGLDYDTSQRDALYKQAVDRAIRAARDMATLAASAAGVKLGAVQEIDVPARSSGGPVMAMPMRLSMASAAPPIAPGTGTISALVSVSYAIGGP